jgi:hypothetical protein
MRRKESERERKLFLSFPTAPPGAGGALSPNSTIQKIGIEKTLNRKIEIGKFGF